MEMLYVAWNYLRQGGWVMIPMVALSLGVWGLILERWLFFRDMEREDPGTSGLPCGGSLPPAAASRLCAPVLRAWGRQRSGEAALDGRILDLHAMRQRKRLHRSLGLIAALAAAAPLLGLFGTVTGMIGTFEAITFFGTGNAKALAAGISEALVTTQSGLLVGIPGLFMARLMSQKARRLQNRLEETVMAARRWSSQRCMQ
jgi:biopolymer transport protein ExbB